MRVDKIERENIISVRNEEEEIKKQKVKMIFNVVFTKEKISYRKASRSNG